MKRPRFNNKCPESAGNPMVTDHEPLLYDVDPYVAATFPGAVMSVSDERRRQQGMFPNFSAEQHDEDTGEKFVLRTSACKHCGHMYTFTEDRE